jgi:hypothetical protein
MALIRQFRNYFFLVTGNPGVRFRTGDKPTQATFNELFCSTGFIKEKDDTASTTSQGFVKIAQDAAAQTRNSTPDIDGFTKAILPHQLPNVFKNPSFPNTAISVVSVFQNTGRVGGFGLDFLIQNTLAVTSAAQSPANPIVVTQAAPGENVVLGFNFSALAALPGQVLVNVNDPAASYLDTAFSTSTPCRISFAAAVGNDTLEVNIKDKINEVTLYHGTNAEYALDFINGIGQGCWTGWVVCDGNVYQNSQSQNVQTPNMIGRIPVGFDTGTLVPAMGTVVNLDADTGTPVTIEEEVVLLFIKYIG